MQAAVHTGKRRARPWLTGRVPCARLQPRPDSGRAVAGVAMTTPQYVGRSPPHTFSVLDWGRVR